MPHNRPVTDDAGSAVPSAQPHLAVDRPRLRIRRRGSEGYRREEVDAFVDRALTALGENPPSLTPEDLDAQRFRVVRVRRGYDMRQVDDWMDALAGQLRRGRTSAASSAAGGRPSPPRHHVRTWWIYAIAVVLVLAMVLFAVTQL